MREHAAPRIGHPFTLRRREDIAIDPRARDVTPSFPFSMRALPFKYGPKEQ